MRLQDMTTPALRAEHARVARQIDELQIELDELDERHARHGEAIREARERLAALRKRRAECNVEDFERSTS